MFLEFFGLQEQPFGVTPDPRFLYLTSSHREALDGLLCGIEAGRGLMSLIAEPGMGKTALLFQLRERYHTSARTAFLFQTQCNSREFLSHLFAAFEIESDGQSLAQMQTQLNTILSNEARAGRSSVLFVDEAHNLQDSVLETVRLISNFETPRTKLVQIVLAGQSSLADKLACHALRRRVSIWTRLKPLTPDEVECYIDHRLRVAGYPRATRGPLFTSDAQSTVAQQSEGVPKNINEICFHALRAGFACSRKTIDVEIIQQVLLDLNQNILASVKDQRRSSGPPVISQLQAECGDSGLMQQASPPVEANQGRPTEARREPPQAVSKDLDEKTKQQPDGISLGVLEQISKQLQSEISAALKTLDVEPDALGKSELSRCIGELQAQITQQVQKHVSDFQATIGEPQRVPFESIAGDQEPSASEAIFRSPSVRPSIFQRVAQRATAKPAWLAAVVAALLLIAFMILFGKLRHRPGKSLTTVVPPASRSRGAQAAKESKLVEIWSTARGQNLNNRDRSAPSQALAPATSAPVQATRAGLPASGAATREQKKPLASHASGLGVTHALPAQPAVKPPLLEDQRPEVAGPAFQRL
jgi:general secretion pathway protein A